MTELKLSKLEPFAVGGRRECYVHPSDASKCVKVLRTDKNVSARRKKLFVPSVLRRRYDNNEDERRVLNKLEKRIGKGMQLHIPLCYGYEPTDLGPGLVLDLVRDTDGKISRSLREHFYQNLHPLEFKDGFDELTRFLCQHNIITRNLLDHNLVASKQADGSWQIYIIDGFGDPALLPIAQWSRTMGRMKIKRISRRAWARFQVFYETRRQNGAAIHHMRDGQTWSPGVLRHR
ncbi:PhoP regulatory network protein YrbL [Limihaloglobus sulfuriphilus]|uniref:PhoP regulatory network protein YrbL n=1 Tax=Limihaloglobus sulfuriphilus TaxID=1851148 RepID=A0A1Q2MG81_9BACT|nr:YrbL family protein [Limihaloglobus sulfuriphilus]AQQ71317.1 PhoP regulatory network protein YrbL [Limihaloglobus sulfuriphilus]